MEEEAKAQQDILSVMIEEIEREGLTLMHLRAVPTNPEVLGAAAREVEPDIKQIFVTGISDEDVPVFERILYKVRKRIENRIDNEDFYICSLSNKNIIYKGMLTSGQLRRYFPDLSNDYFTSGLALVHSRFSTNTFPKWKLAQPFRLLAHNGEINTIRGNRGWMKARESVLNSEALGDIKDLRPIVQDGMSDSAIIPNCFPGNVRLALAIACIKVCAFIGLSKYKVDILGTSKPVSHIAHTNTNCKLLSGRLNLSSISSPSGEI